MSSEWWRGGRWRRWYLGGTISLGLAVLVIVVFATATDDPSWIRIVGWTLMASLVWQTSWTAAFLFTQPSLRRHLDAWDRWCWAGAAVAAAWGVIEVFDVSPFNPWVGRFGVLIIGVGIGAPYLVRMLRLMKRDLAEIEAWIAVPEQKETP